MAKMTTAQQTAHCNRLREFLQSIAIQAVQAQDQIGTDSCDDTLQSIESDLKVAIDISNTLNMADM